MSNAVLSQDDEYPSMNKIGLVPRCTPGLGGPCKTLVYAPVSVGWVNDLMRDFSERNNLVYGVDVIPLPGGDPSVESNHSWCEGNNATASPCGTFLGGFPDPTCWANQTKQGHFIFPCSFFNDNATLVQYLLDTPNATQNAVLFTSAYMKAPPLIAANLVPAGYNLYYNATISQFPFLGDNHAMETKLSLDACLASRRAGYNVTLSAEYSKFPSPPPRIVGYSVVAQNGGIWFYLPPMITFFVILTEIVGEKEGRLRLGMRMIGLKSSAYWVSYFITGAVYVCLISLLMILSGVAAQFALFINSSFAALMLLFLLFGLAMLTMAFFFSTIIARSKTAQTFGYAAVLVGFVFQTILCLNYGSLIDLLFSDDVAAWVVVVRWILIFYPPFNFSKAYYDISNLASSTYNAHLGKIVKGPGFSWSDVYSRRTVHTFGVTVVSPSFMQTMSLLCLNCAIYSVLTWYLDNVLPGEHGSPRPLYFPFLPSYWYPGSTASRKKKKQSSAERRAAAVDGASLVKADDDEDVAAETLAAAAAGSDPNAVVRLLGITKTYNSSIIPGLGTSVCAVDGVSLTIPQDCILGLLGHNGAGKTTTINMLTGLFPPSTGSAYIYGHSVAEDMDVIRSLTGVVPQHDILWPELTAEEHLWMFARLKGVPPAQVEAQIADKLALLDLSAVRRRRVGAFSGGMKRRLSVAIAALGDPKIIFMDEPTTGMDPVNRRAAWRMVQKLKRGRVIVLTTHSMEEADCLGDRIAIMAHGRIRCLGNSLHLKNKYGSGYRVSVVTAPANVTTVVSGVLEALPSAQLVNRDAGSLAFSVPFEKAAAMPPLLQYLESNEGGLVGEWGVSHSTLEEVFLRVTKQSNFTFSAIEGEGAPDAEQKLQHALIRRADSEEESGQRQDSQHSVTGPSAGAVVSSHNLIQLSATAAGPSSGGSDSAGWDSKPPSSRTFTALMRKNFTLQKRQTGQNCCQIVTPVFVMLILIILQAIIKSQLPANQTILIPSVPYPLNQGVTGAPGGADTGSKCLKFFFFSDATANKAAGSLSETGVGSGMLSALTQTNCTLYNGTVVKVPYYQPRASLSAMETEVFRDLDTLNGVALTKLDDQPYPSYLTPDGYTQFNTITSQASAPAGAEPQLSYSFAINDDPVAKYHRPNGFTRLSVKVPKFFQSKVLLTTQGRLAMMQLNHDAYMQTIAPPPSLGPFQPLVEFVQLLFGNQLVSTMPQLETSQLLGAVEIIGSFLYPLALTLQLPVYVFITVMEKEARLREMQKSMGMSMTSYFATSYLFNFSLYCAVVAFFWGIGYAVDLRFFVQTDPGLLFVVFFGWGHALVALGFVIASFISKRRIATVVGYIIVLFGNGIALLLCDGIYGNIPGISLDTSLPSGLLVYPQFSFVRIIYKLNFACAAKMACYGPLYTLGLDDEVTRCIISLYGDAAYLLLLAYYLDNVLPTEYGVPKHPLFFLPASVREFLCCGPCRKSSNGGDNGNRKAESAGLLALEQGLLSPGTVAEEIDPNEDTDVRAERLAVADLPDVRGDGSQAIVVRALQKVFPGANGTPPKRAVRSVSFTVNRGECFGLLGENGAGKTTTISMLTGVFPPSAGEASVAGLDIAKSLSDVHMYIGVCPQHDLVWDTLTVEEHLLFYARVKGVPTSEEDAHVRESLQDVGLWGFRHRLAQRLSGGMKRRLSIAIALSGRSRVVFLDEPTTGLDPASRRHVWNILERAREKRGRALVLTTHSMDEAELLCSRIGIMTHGRMRCLGNQQHLKNRFGGGYRLHLNCVPGNEETVSAALREVLPAVTADQSSSFPGYLEYCFDSCKGDESKEEGGGLRISELFAALEELAPRTGITDWGVGQVGLEDVFQRIVRQHEHDNSDV